MVRGQTLDEPFKDSKGVSRSREVLQPLLGPNGTPVLPASSLKGVLRSTAERILRSLQPERSPDQIPLADHPFVNSRNEEGDMSADVYRDRLKQQGRGEIADSELIEWNDQRKQYTDDQLKPDQIYKLLSPASQLFGATVHAGLLTLTDAQPQSVKLQRRSHVAIDRLTGGVGEGPFIEELSPANVPLTSTLRITNFALRHLALLALTVQEINAGFSAIGGGTRKGQGRVKIALSGLEFAYSAATNHYSNGIISAQACLAAQNLAADVPEGVRKHEVGVVILPDLAPLPSQDWRNDGLVRFAVPEARLDECFQSAVRDAWVPWVRDAISEGGA
jgi:CRISPR/Cas system CSM-associated protein Csm3 (group 7 of RAMP superfamily)